MRKFIYLSEDQLVERKTSGIGVISIIVVGEK